jgi:hypothetical protein
MTTHTPLRCANSAMIQRGTNEVVLMDTGNYPSYSSFLNETWTWNGTDWHNTGATLIDPNGPLPGRINMAMTYDGYNVVLFGGQGAASGLVLEDTWVWNGTAWTQKHPASAPFARWDAQFVNLGLKAILFGGAGGSGSGVMLNETWQWDGNLQTWSQLTPTTSPPARVGHAMASNGSNEVVMFGGAISSGEFKNDTWTFNGTTWTLVHPATSPSARAYSVMAYDSVNSKWVLFGGQNEYNFLPETWTFNGTTWTQVSVGAGPDAKIRAQMCFDTQSGKTILFGGIDASTNYPSNETWAFNGATNTWTKL